MKTAKRLELIQEYYFSRKLKEINSLISSGKPIINLGIGSPDIMPPSSVVEKLKKSLDSPVAHKYQGYKGIQPFRTAIKDFYQNNYNVKLDPNSQILPLIGSKEGIMHISLAFLDEGDEVLIPNPGYPTYSAVTKIVGAKPIYYSLKESKSWLPDINELTKLDLSKVKIMWINYPNMPDNPYSFILNENPTSLLYNNENCENCLELNSLSKSHNMAGWRLGMVVGSKNNIQSILKIKSNMDSGMFFPVQQGAIEALNQNKKWYSDLNSIYKKRKDIVIEICNKLNLKYYKNGLGLFIWAKINNSSTKSKDFTDKLLYSKNIFITPGSIFGTAGEGYVRISLCQEEKKLIEALNRL